MKGVAPGDREYFRRILLTCIQLLCYSFCTQFGPYLQISPLKPRLIENAGVKFEISRLLLNFCSKSHCREKLTASCEHGSNLNSDPLRVSVRWRGKDTTHKTMRVRGALRRGKELCKRIQHCCTTL